MQRTLLLVPQAPPSKAGSDLGARLALGIIYNLAAYYISVGWKMLWSVKFGE